MSNYSRIKRLILMKFNHIDFRIVDITKSYHLTEITETKMNGELATPRYSIPLLKSREGFGANVVSPKIRVQIKILVYYMHVIQSIITGLTLSAGDQCMLL